MEGMNSIVLFGIAVVLLIVLMRTIKIVPQKQVKIIERLGRYHRTAEAGLNTIVPFLDSVRDTIDLREQITKIEPQSVITRDNVTMEVDAVIYYLVADPVRARGRLVFGPSSDGARLEGSKRWMKELLAGAGVPTAAHGSFHAGHSRSSRHAGNSSYPCHASASACACPAAALT